MKEILPNIYHWTTFHEGIQSMVHSYYVENKRTAFLIDPRIPTQGLAWFHKHRLPTNIYLTNRLHFRHSAEFTNEFGCQVWCHRKGLSHFAKNQTVKSFVDRQRLPGGVIALNVAFYAQMKAFFLFHKQVGL